MEICTARVTPSPGYDVVRWCTFGYICWKKREKERSIFELVLSLDVAVEIDARRTHASHSSLPRRGTRAREHRSKCPVIQPRGGLTRRGPPSCTDVCGPTVGGALVSPEVSGQGHSGTSKGESTTLVAGSHDQKIIRP